MNAGVRTLIQGFPARPTLEGAGVRLRRVFGYSEKELVDPFLLLDHFGSKNPKDYLAGFPWHPHRGIETVTYLVEGKIEHKDSLNNSGVINSGDVQWMTAGSGIIHQEMPQKYDGEMRGFQLWVNLPRAKKMTAPLYREVLSSAIPSVETPEGRVLVVAGDYEGVRGPVQDIVVEPAFFDVAVHAGKSLALPVKKADRVIVYVFEGSLLFGDEAVGPAEAALLGPGEKVLLSAGPAPVRCLFLSGRPLGEPIAWQGPVVMNTRSELEQAFRDYSEGTFVKAAGP